MKHPSSKALFAHWSDKRAKGIIPDRRDMDPAALRGALGDVFILGLDAGAGHPFRLAGTRLCSLFCRELRGTRFLDLWDERGREEIARLVALAAEEAVGIVGAVSARAPHQASVELEMTLLPLRHHGQPQGRLIGSLAPMRMPYWIGLHPVASLDLARCRFLGAAVEAPAPVFKPPADVGSYGRLRVHQGGRR